ncbi:hypothetical protein BGX38DRAFT_618379 [Terfezia claveryi]|nr:hypothetical protein BGX38DRAFT_618379 [Terfezia claveryi]
MPAASPQLKRWLAEPAADGSATDPRFWESGSQRQNAGANLGGISPAGTGLELGQNIPPPLRKYLMAARDNNDNGCVHKKILEFAVEDVDPVQQSLAEVTEGSAHVSECNRSNECRCFTPDVEDMDPVQQSLAEVTEDSVHVSECNRLNECRCFTPDRYPHMPKYLASRGIAYTALLKSLHAQKL